PSSPSTPSRWRSGRAAATWRARPPLRPGQPVPRRPLHRASPRGPRRGLGRFARRQLRQRPRRERQRALQGGADPPPPLADDRAGRARHRQLGRVVEHRAPALGLRRRPARGVRGSLRTETGGRHHGSLKALPRVSTKSRLVQSADTNPERPYLVLIDEINRGNIPKIFGELVTLLERD